MVVVGSGRGRGGMATVPGDRPGGCGGQQRGGMSLGDAGVGIVVLGAATVDAVGVEIVEAGQVRVLVFVFGLVEQRFARWRLVPGGLLPTVSHGCRCLRRGSRGRRRQGSRKIEGGQSEAVPSVCLYPSVCLSQEKRVDNSKTTVKGPKEESERRREDTRGEERRGEARRSEAKRRRSERR